MSLSNLNVYVDIFNILLILKIKDYDPMIAVNHYIDSDPIILYNNH